MIRKQIVIDADRDATLMRLASERGISQSELIRTAIDEFAERAAREGESRAAFSRLMNSFESAPDLGLTDQSGRRVWKREDLHR